MAEPDDDSLTRYMYSDVPGLAEPKDPLRPKTRDETYAKVRPILDAHLVYDQLDPEIATESSLVEFSGIVALEIVTMAMLLEAVDSVEELIPWLVVVKLEIGKIKKRRYAKRGDGTRRHGRPPDHGPFGLSESWNMGVYPGRGPALISRADMIILPPTTPSSIIFKDSATLSAGVSGHSAAEDTVTDTFRSTFAVDSTPGPLTPTAMRDETSMEPPAPHAPRLI